MNSTQCPACRARVRQDDPWCPLCHLDLRPAPEPVALAVVPSAPSVDRDAGKRGRHARVASWPCTACGAENGLESARCRTCGSAFLADLQSDAQAPLRLPLISRLNKLGRPARFGVAVGIGVLCALLLSGVLALAGAVL